MREVMEVKGVWSPLSPLSSPHLHHLDQAGHSGNAGGARGRPDGTRSMLSLPGSEFAAIRFRGNRHAWALASRRRSG